MNSRSLLTGFLLSLSSVLHASSGLVPNDAAVRTGKLDNGLTYYIRRNTWPEQRANFYIVQRVGSMQEEEHQRGLAHFLEHMCFNGTDHFPGNTLIRYLESIGVQFGTDLNAYTGTEETVYNINNVPTLRPTTLDSCLLILSDWAAGLTLDGKEIDRERGVINEEWRQRDNAQRRMMERAMPQLFPHSKHAHRMPIGLMSVVNGFEHKALRDYYKKWYHPDNQCVIIVGDVDVDTLEAKLKARLGTLRRPARPALPQSFEVPDNADPIVIIEKDPEQTTNQVDILFKRPTVPAGHKQSVNYMAQTFVRTAALMLVNARLAEALENPSCPYLGAQTGYGPYLVARTKDAFGISLAAKEGTAEESVTAVYAEVLRAARDGFTPGEYTRLQASMLSGLDRLYAMRDRQANDKFCQALKNHFLDGEPYPSTEDYCQTMRRIVPSITLEELNRTFRQLVPENDSNLVILSFNHEAEGQVYPSAKGLLNALHLARMTKMKPYVDQFKDEPLIARLPYPGRIVKEEAAKRFDYTVLTLSNGVKVNLKHTASSRENISLTGECPGGYLLYGPEDWANARLFNRVVAASRLGRFSTQDLRKALAGKMASASLSIDDLRVHLSASGSPKDLEAMFQLAYLQLTDIRPDTLAFGTLMRGLYADLQAQDLFAEQAFSDSVTSTLYGHNPLQRSLRLDDLRYVSLDRIMQMAKEQTDCTGDFEFTLIGNFDEAAVRPLIERYLGSLPPRKGAKAGTRSAYYQKGVVENRFTRAMETPRTLSAVIWYNDKIKFTQRNAIMADVAGQILSMIYLQKVREDAGAAYSLSANGSVNRYADGYTVALLSVEAPLKPELLDTALAILRAEPAALVRHCDASMLDKVKTLMLKQSDDIAGSNGYWAHVLQMYRRHGIDWHTQRKAIIASLRPQDISAFMKRFLKAGHRMEVIMLPQE